MKRQKYPIEVQTFQEIYFEGRRDLFKDLAIDRMDVEWTPRPVLHIDFNAENYQVENGLETILNRIFGDYERKSSYSPREPEGWRIIKD